MVGFTITFVGKEDTIGDLLRANLSFEKLCSPPPNISGPLWKWKEKHWGSIDGPYESCLLDTAFYMEGINLLKWYMGIDNSEPPYPFFTHLATKYPELRIYAHGGYSTGGSYLHYHYVADFHPQTGKRRIQHMDWEEDDYWYLTPVDHPSKEELEWDEERIQQPHQEEEDIPCEGEEMFDTLRKDNPSCLLFAEECGIKIKNCEDWEYYEETIYSELEYRNWREYEQLLEEVPSGGELEWDEECIQQPHWYEMNEIEEAKDDIEHLLPHELCGGCECVRSYYYGQYHQDYDNDWVTGEHWLHCWREEQEEIEQWELEQEIPTKDELEFDELRANHGGIFELADKQGFKLKNCDEYERAYEELYEAGWQDDLLREFYEKQDYEDHLIYLETESTNILSDSSH